MKVKREVIRFWLILGFASGIGVLNAQFTQLANARICLDPGHGGHDSNDRPTNLGLPIIYYESDANWQAVNYTDTLLRAFGAQVKLTKTTNDPSAPDRDPSLSDRVQVANAFNSDYFHSFHTNGANNPDANYTLVLYAGPSDGNADDPNALAMAQIMDDELYEYMKTTFAIARADIPFTGFTNGLGVLNGLSMPGTLSEASFHSNLNEGRRLMSSAYRKAAAWGITKSFLKYYEEALPTTGELGGVVTDQSGNAINGIKVTLNPGTEDEKVFIGDDFLNGFYFFDWLEPGGYPVLYEKEGYISQMKTINITNGNYREEDITLTDPNAAPSIPKLLSLSNPSQGSGVLAEWVPNSEVNLLGYRLYYAVDDGLSDWELAADEMVITSEMSSISIDGSDDFIVVPSSDVYHFRLTAVAESGAESSFDDIYSRSSNSGGDKILIVDGFDRYTGSASFSQNRHDFATDYYNSIRDSKYAQVHTTANETVEDGSAILNDYDLVVWFLGDESTADETFSDLEQDIIEDYLKSGGKLFVSGAEVAWDLDQKGSASDKSFFTNYMKASYQTDGASNYTPAKGIAGSFFEGLTLEFGIAYPEDYPDDIDPVGGATSILNYNVSGTRAGVAFKGSFGSSDENGGLVYIGFPLETTSISDQRDMMKRVLEYLEIGSDVPVSVQDHSSELFGTQIKIFPNPSGGKTFLELSVENNIKSELRLSIFDAFGMFQSGKTIKLNEDKQIFDLKTEQLNPGLYFVQLKTRNQSAILKLMIK